jgi:peptidoglycan lytic transglycosylase
VNCAHRSEFGFGLLPRWSTLCSLCLISGCFLAGCAARNSVASRNDSPGVRATEGGERPAGGNDSVRPNEDLAAASVTAKPLRLSSDASVLLPTGRIQEGNASWYGIPFHGRHASNGEIYDMHKLTAAHRTLPFDTVVRVTNLANGKSTIVRITDRGPFVENRIIDLSMAAAREIDSIGPGVVPVRVEILSRGDPGSGFFTVQVGAFRDRNNAERLRERLGPSYEPIFIQRYDSPEGLYYRVRVGKVPGEDAARQFGEQLRSREGFTPFVVRLDEGSPAGGNP